MGQRAFHFDSGLYTRLGAGMSNRGLKLPKPKSKPKKRKEGSEELPLSKKVWAGILGGATLIGGIVAVVTLFPRMTVSFSDAVDSSNPFSSSITVTNTGLIPLKSVLAEIAVRDIAVQKPTGEISFTGGANYKTRFIGGDIHYLGLDDRYTFALNDLGIINGALQKFPMVRADIGIVVSYEIPFLHVRREKLFPEVARKQSNGNFYWYAVSPPE